jgi:hypothetical protein
LDFPNNNDAMPDSTASGPPSQRTKNNPTAVTFTLKPRTKGLCLAETDVTASLDDTQHDLCKRIARLSRLPINRVRATVENSKKVVDVRVHPENPPKVRDIADVGTVLVVKDLGEWPKNTSLTVGPQVSWRFVYFIEYLGPLFFHPLFYYFQQFFYGRTFEHSQMQKSSLQRQC